MNVELENQSSVDLEIGKAEGVNFDIGKNKNSTSYIPLTDKPSINGVELVGNKTLEELGITDIELIPNIYPESIEEDLEYNQVYNGNAIHDLARLFGMTLAELVETLPVIVPNFDIELTYEDNEVYNANAIHQLLEIFGYEIEMIREEFDELYNATEEIYKATEELYNKRPFEINATFTLATQKLTGITSYYDEIKQAYDEGRPIKLKVTVTESQNIANADISVLDVTRNSAFFYPIMRTNIGNGTQIYFFDVEIGQNSGSLTSHVLQTTSLGE